MEDLINEGNKEFEDSWTKAFDILKIVPTISNPDLAFRRLASYNPKNQGLNDYDQRSINSVKTISNYILKLNNDIKKGQNTSKNFVKLGHCYFLLNDLPNANASYAQAVKLNPKIDDPLFWFCFGCAFQHFKYYEEALKCYENVNHLNSDLSRNADFKFRYAILLRKIGNYEKAIEIFLSLLDFPPKNLTKNDVTIQLAYTYQLCDDNSKAYASYNSLFTNFPNNLTVLRQFMMFFAFQSDEFYLNVGYKTIASLPANYLSDPYIKLAEARINFSLNNIQNSYSIYSQCFKYWADNAAFWCWIADIYFTSNQLEDAKPALMKAIFINPYIPLAWINLSFISENKNEVINAIKIIEKGMELNPNSEELRVRNEELKKGIKMKNAKIFSKMDFFTQPLEEKTKLMIDDPIEIPSEAISGDSSLQRAIDAIVEKRVSCFK